MTTGHPDASAPEAGAAPGDPRRGPREEPGRSERIARAAREIFAREGLNVGYNEVARAAGVGVGTVYRRYPTREALILAALGASHDQMAEIAADALAMADPWEALVTFLERGLEMLSGNLGLRDVALGSHPAGDGPAGLSYRFGPVIDQLLERASAAGRLRDGVTAADLLVLQCTLTELARHSRDVHEPYPRRYLQIFMDGIRYRDGQPALGHGASLDQAREVTRAWTARARRLPARGGAD
jgi:AcrR family transcriptional regulator